MELCPLFQVPVHERAWPCFGCGVCDSCGAEPSPDVHVYQHHGVYRVGQSFTGRGFCVRVNGVRPTDVFSEFS